MPDDACKHEDWQATATLHRDRETADGPVTAWSVELEMTCVLCLTPMQWLSVEQDRAVFALLVACQPFAAQIGGSPS